MYVSMKEHYWGKPRRELALGLSKNWVNQYDHIMSEFYQRYNFSHGTIMRRLLDFDTTDLAGTKDDRIIDPRDRAFWINWSLERAIKFIYICSREFTRKYGCGDYGRVPDFFFENTAAVMIFDTDDMIQLIDEARAISYADSPHTFVYREKKIFADLEVMVKDRKWVPNPKYVVFPDRTVGGIPVIVTPEYQQILDNKWPDTIFLQLITDPRSGPLVPRNSGAYLKDKNKKSIKFEGKPIPMSGEESKAALTVIIAKAILDYEGVNVRHIIGRREV